MVSTPASRLFGALFLLLPLILLTGCATDSVVHEGMTPLERDRAIFTQFLNYSPQSSTPVSRLSFPGSGRSGLYSVEDREFSQLRRDLDRMESMNLNAASPDVRSHILNTINLWRRIASEQPRLHSVARTAENNTRSATQAGAQIGADIGRGDPITAGAGALLGQMAARAPMERIFEDHQRAYSGRVSSLIVTEMNLSRRLGIPVSPLLAENLDQLQGRY